MEPHGRRSNDLACEALTARGEPCRAFGSDVVDLGDAGVRRLCGYHGHMAKHRPIGLWDRPIEPAELTPESTTMPRWSAADDALLLAHADEPAAAVAGGAGVSRGVGFVAHALGLALAGMSLK